MAIRTIGAALLLFATGACAPISPNPSVNPSVLPSRIGGMPAGQPTSIDIGVEMSADNMIVTLRFIGGPILLATNPCHTEYAGWAMQAGDILDVAVVLLPNTLPVGQTPFACPAVGADRAVQVKLAEPFLGILAKDVPFGNLISIERLPS